MRLIHYSREPLEKVDSVPHNPKDWRGQFKPQGLWVSVEGDDDWLEWCKAEKFNLSLLACATEIILADDHGCLILSTAEELDKFTKDFPNENSPVKDLRRSGGDIYAIDWAKVQSTYRGLIIAPYIWRRRLSLMWYYGWDCASGCIWDNAAIKEIRAIEPPDLSDIEREHAA